MLRVPGKKKVAAWIQVGTLDLVKFIDTPWQAGIHTASPRTVPGKRYVIEEGEVERRKEGGREEGREGGRWTYSAELLRNKD